MYKKPTVTIIVSGEVLSASILGSERPLHNSLLRAIIAFDVLASVTRKEKKAKDTNIAKEENKNPSLSSSIVIVYLENTKKPTNTCRNGK